jgi:hypothetical protein
MEKSSLLSLLNRYRTIIDIVIDTLSILSITVKVNFRFVPSTYFIKIYVNGDWGLRNVTGNIEKERIEMTVVDIEEEKKRDNRNSTSDVEG